MSIDVNKLKYSIQEFGEQEYVTPSFYRRFDVSLTDLFDALRDAEELVDRCLGEAPDSGQIHGLAFNYRAKWVKRGSDASGLK